jgi:transcriptional regulator of acetoin/glycerol metabolism
MKNDIEKTFIVPPGLSRGLQVFKDHCAVAEKKPIIIVGPTGVGKTLFYRSYLEIFNNDNKIKNGEVPVIRANCAHFGNQKSDLNISRVELFGIKDKVLQGVNKRIGLVKKANKGILFLEEIGELPLGAQAMLLTFIEDGKYLMLGDSKETKSDCQIIGATNNEDALREDFKNRFFPFYVPALHERRKDVLYYLYDKWPDLVKSLSKYEVLTLLAYNWPGNVREVERIARLILRYQKYGDRINLDEPWKRAIYKSFRTHDLDLGGGPSSIHNELDKKGVDVEFLESLLNKYNVGLLDRSDDLPFKGIVDNRPQVKDNGHGIKIYEPFEPFEQAYYGYMNYCGLFLQDYLSDKNVLKDLTECNVTPSLIPGKDYKKKDGRKLNNLSKAIFEFLSGIELDKSFKWPTSSYELKGFFYEYSKIYPSNRFIISALHKQVREETDHTGLTDEILSLTQKELLTLYYKGLLKRENDNAASAARIADINYETFHSALIRHGLRPKKNISRKR